MSRPRVLIVGLDGATFDVIRPLAAQGQLPNLSRLMANGAWGPLRSTIPPITPTAWTTFFTGKNPGKHGIYDFQELDRQSYEFRSVRADRHGEKSLWQLLSEAGLRSIVLDVPYTYPPRPLNGLLISGYGTPRTPQTVFTYPANLADLLPADLRPEIRVALPNHLFDRSQAFIDEWEGIFSGRERLIRHLMHHEEWDFFMVVFSATDTMGHVFWTYVEPTHPNYARPEAAHFRQAFFGAYRRCDQLLGQMMAWAGDQTTTLVMSDHGFGSVRPRQYLFQQLNEAGYLAYQSPPLLALFSDRLMKLGLKVYASFPRLREWFKNLRPGRQEAVKQTLWKGGLLPGGHAIDPTRSKTIPSNYGLQIWLNKQGEFAKGLVDPADQARLLAELTTYLLSGRDKPTGRAIIEAVYQGQQLYHGPNAPAGPDLVFDYVNFYDPHNRPTANNPHLEGGHTPYGILLASGEMIQPGQVSGATLMDLAPTVLHLLGQPIPPDMDGRPLTALFSPAYLAQHPVQFGNQPAQTMAPAGTDDYTPAEEAEIANQLRQLGYL